MSKKCVKCGAELEEAAIFCDECGAQQVPVETVSSAQASSQSNNLQSGTIEQTTDKRKNSGFGIASLVLGLISICTLGIFVIPEILGLIFGIIDITNKTTKHGLSVTGITTSVIAALLFITIMVI